MFFNFMSVISGSSLNTEADEMGNNLSGAVLRAYLKNTRTQ